MSSSPEDTLCPVCGDPFDFDVSSFPTEQDKRTSRLPLFSHKCIHNVCATCIVDWDSKGSNFNKWQRCPVCLALTSFNANVLPNGIDLKKCTLLRMVAQASATAGSTGIASTSAASSAMTSSATATATNNNEGDSASTDAFTDSRVTARAERNIRRNTVREIALANAAAARAARSARSASTTTMTTPDHGRDLDNKSAGSSIGLTAGSNIGLTSPTANVAPSNAMRTDSSAAIDVSSVARFNRSVGNVPTYSGASCQVPAQAPTDAVTPTSNAPSTATHDGLSSVIENLQSVSIAQRSTHPAPASTPVSTRAQVSQGGTVDSAERAAQSASLLSQEEIDQQLAQTLSRQSLQEYLRNGGNLEDILRHNSVSDGAFLNATFDLFLDWLGNNVTIENLNTYAALDNPQLRPNILRRFRQNVLALVLPTAYDNAINLTGSGHFGAVIRLRDLSRNQQNRGFFWLYIDTESTGRDERQAAVLQHLRRHEVILEGEDFRFFSAFPQAENECVASTPYVVLAILNRYLRGESIHDMRFRGVYDSVRVIRSWMYWSLRNAEPILPLVNFDDMAVALEARASPPSLASVSSPAPAPAPAPATSTGLIGASFSPDTTLPGSATSGFGLGFLGTASTGGTASNLLSGDPAPLVLSPSTSMALATPGGFGLSSAGIAGTSGADPGVVPTSSTAVGVNTGLFAAPDQSPANSGFGVGFTGTAVTGGAAPGLSGGRSANSRATLPACPARQIATRENGTNLLSATAPSLPSPGVSNPSTASPSTGTFSFGAASPNAVGANGTSVFGSPAPSAFSPSISSPSTAAPRAGVVSFGAASIIGTGGGIVSGVPFTGPTAAAGATSTAFFAGPAPSASSPSISSPSTAAPRAGVVSFGATSIIGTGGGIGANVGRNAAPSAAPSQGVFGFASGGIFGTAGYASGVPPALSTSLRSTMGFSSPTSATGAPFPAPSLASAGRLDTGSPSPSTSVPTGPAAGGFAFGSSVPVPTAQSPPVEFGFGFASPNATGRNNISTVENLTPTAGVSSQPFATSTQGESNVCSAGTRGSDVTPLSFASVAGTDGGFGAPAPSSTEMGFGSPPLAPLNQGGLSNAAAHGAASSAPSSPPPHASATAPVTFGPSAQPHSVTSRTDGATMIHLHSISAMPESYEGWSHEELRLADYVEARRQQELLRRNGNGSGNGGGSG